MLHEDGPRWPRPAGRGPVVALGKLVADSVLELSEPLVVGGQPRVVRTTTAGGALANLRGRDPHTISVVGCVGVRLRVEGG